MRETTVNCSDCGYAARPMTTATLNKGSSVREPGEALCAGCSSRRTKMVKEVMALPDTLDQIKALRMSVGLSIQTGAA